jgi:L-ascorbate metabolism protein UlaG (beta-lactamase superfamily)
MEIIWVGHASFEIKVGGKVIYIDPYFGEYKDMADIILISHGHYDHSSMEKIGSVSGDNTVVLTVSEVALKIHGAIVMSPGQIKDVAGVKVQAVDAYNVGKSFHPKGSGLGFVVMAEGKSVYFSGDTDRIPEMKKVKADVVLVPVGGTYTMNANEAAMAVLDIKPKVAIPMHFGSGIVGTMDDAELFKEKVEAESDVKVVILGHGKSLNI